MEVIEHRVEGYAIGRVVAQQFGVGGRIASQGAAQCDVDFLKAPANPEHRAAKADHVPDDAQRNPVAAGVEGATIGTGASSDTRETRPDT